MHPRTAIPTIITRTKRIMATPRFWLLVEFGLRRPESHGVPNGTPARCGHAGYLKAAWASSTYESCTRLNSAPDDADHNQDGSSPRVDRRYPHRAAAPWPLGRLG